MKAVYNAFDIATLASAFGEGFPNAVGEAMACGIPVAATDVGDVRSIAGSSGEVVPPKNPDLLCAAWQLPATAPRARSEPARRRQELHCCRLRPRGDGAQERRYSHQTHGRTSRTTNRARIPAEQLEASHAPSLRHQPEQMTGAAQHPRQALTLGKAKAQTQKHFPGVEQPHGLGTIDGRLGTQCYRADDGLRRTAAMIEQAIGRFLVARTSRASRTCPQSGTDGPPAAMACTLCDGAAERALVSSPADAAGRRDIGGGCNLRGRLGCRGRITGAAAE